MNGINSVNAEALCDYTALDFAIIALLERIKNNVVQPKIEEWLRLIRQSSLSQSSENRRLRNLAAGLLSIWDEMLASNDADEQKVKLEEFVWHASEYPKDDLCDLIEQHGHLLFNCYYYTLIKEFGQEGLVPAIPGYTYPSKEEGVEHLSNFIRRSRLPLQLNKTYLDTYSTLILPLRAGITPQYLRLYRSKVETQESWIVPNFLGDLAILQKREDFVHRHLCAIIVVLRNGDQLHGAFVLTSAIPEELTQENRIVLQETIQASWNFAPLNEVHRGIHRTARSIHPYLEWVGHGEQIDSHQRGKQQQQLKEHIQQCLADMVPNGTYALRGSLYDASHHICRLAAVNSEGIQRILGCHFPTNAWLAPDIVKSKKSLPSDDLIDIERLELICKTLKDISSLKTKRDKREQAFHEILALPSSRGLMRAVFPDVDESKWSTILSASELRAIYNKHRSRCASLLVLRTPSEERLETIPPLKNLDIVAEELGKAFHEPELTGATNSFLASLQRLWNQSQEPSKKALDSVSDDEIGGLASHLQLLLGETTVRGILLLIDRTLYVPKFEPLQSSEPEEQASVREEFRTAFLSYPSFWLLESLCHSFAEDIEISAFQKHSHSKKMTSPPFCSTSNTNAYTVFFSTNNSNNKVVASAFTYLGIPIAEWLPPDSQPTLQSTAWKVPVYEADLQNWITARYREYLQDRLKVGEEDESISRSLRSFRPDRGKPRVNSIEVQKCTDDNIHMTISLKGLAQNERVKWHQVPTVDLAFCAFPVGQLSEKHANVEPAIRETKSLELQVEVLQANGSTERLFASSDNIPVLLESLYQNLYDGSQTLRWGFQAGQNEKLIRFNHEAQLGLSMINSLYDIAPNPAGSRPEEISPNSLDKLETAKMGMALLRLSFSAILDWIPNSSLLSIDPRVDPDGYLIELVKLAVYAGIADVIRRGDLLSPNLAHPLLRILKNTMQKNTFTSYNCRIVVEPTARKWKAEQIVLVPIANAVKHQLSYLRRRLIDEELLPSIPQDFWDKTIIARLDMESNSLTVENLGPPGMQEDFNQRFIMRTGHSTRQGTHAVLLAALKDRIWLTPGMIDLDVRPVDSNCFDSLAENVRLLLKNSSRYVVQLRLPKPFFEVS